MVKPKFKKGDRVRFSEKWLLMSDRREKEARRVGTIVSPDGHLTVPDTATVDWDGYRSRERYHRDFLELIPNDD